MVVGLRFGHSNQKQHLLVSWTEVSMEGLLPLWLLTTSEPFRELSLDKSTVCGTCQRIRWAGRPMEAFLHCDSRHLRAFQGARF